MMEIFKNHTIAESTKRQRELNQLEPVLAIVEAFRHATLLSRKQIVEISRLPEKIVNTKLQKMIADGRLLYIQNIKGSKKYYRLPAHPS